MKVSWAELEAFQDSLVLPTCGHGRAAGARSFGASWETRERKRVQRRVQRGRFLNGVVGLQPGVVTAYSPYSIRRIRCRQYRALKAQYCHPLPAFHLFSWFQVSKPSSIAIFRGHRSSAPAPIIYRAKCLLTERGGVLGFRAGDSTFLRVRGAPDGLVSWLFILVADVEGQRMFA